MAAAEVCFLCWLAGGPVCSLVRDISNCFVQLSRGSDGQSAAERGRGGNVVGVDAVDAEFDEFDPAGASAAESAPLGRGPLLPDGRKRRRNGRLFAPGVARMSQSSDFTRQS